MPTTVKEPVSDVLGVHDPTAPRELDPVAPELDPAPPELEPEAPELDPLLPELELEEPELEPPW